MDERQVKEQALRHLTLVLHDIEHHTSGVSWLRYQEGIAVGIVETLLMAGIISDREQYDLRTEISCAVAVALGVV